MSCLYKLPNQHLLVLDAMLCFSTCSLPSATQREAEARSGVEMGQTQVLRITKNQSWETHLDRHGLGLLAGRGRVEWQQKGCYLEAPWVLFQLVAAAWVGVQGLSSTCKKNTIKSVILH